MKRLALVLVLVLTTASCTDASRSKLGGFGDSFKVELLNCDGAVARRWISSGKVLSEANSDGYYFKDSKTNTLIEVTGTLIITRID
tara:strand:+ start:154 stop:411 length:258 start_codon:yes stop_codon:yes gene_type:complete